MGYSVKYSVLFPYRTEIFVAPSGVQKERIKVGNRYYCDGNG